MAPGAAQPLPAALLPPRGTATLRYEAGQVSIAAHAAPRRPLLEQLAREAGFALETGSDAWPPLTLRADGLSLEQALPLLVGDLEYRAEWAQDPASGAHRLVFLGVGAPRGRAPETESPASGAEIAPSEAPALPDDAVASALDAALRELRDGDLPPEPQEALRERLEDPDPEVRLRAALELEPEGAALERLRDLLANDPDPRVRAAATVGLENADRFAAVEALVAALDDPHPEVVLEVIDSLEFAGDGSVVGHLAPLLGHPDPRVRDAAAEAIEFLAD